MAADLKRQKWNAKASVQCRNDQGFYLKCLDKEDALKMQGDGEKLMHMRSILSWWACIKPKQEMVSRTFYIPYTWKGKAACGKTKST